MVTTCKNCNKKFVGRFCNYCGQSASTAEINKKYLWRELQYGLLPVDRGFLFTTRELFTRPGLAIKEFIDGKRIAHFKPVGYVIILSTVYALLSYLLSRGNTMDEITITTQSPFLKESELIRHFSDFGNWMKEHYAYSTLILLPVISLSTYLAFSKSRYNFLKHLVLNCYIAGQRTIVFILMLPLFAIFKNTGAISFLENIETLAWVGLTSWTYVQFFDNNSILKNIKLTLLSFVYLFFMAVILLMAMAVAIVVTA